MDDYIGLFNKLTGKTLTKRFVDFESNKEIDETIFETVSRLLFGNRKIFYYLKRIIVNVANKKDDAILFSTAGYFCYVDCDFEKAREFFQKAIKINPRDLEAWFCLAFCFRQMGEEEKFNTIILDYKSVITDFINGKSNLMR